MTWHNGRTLWERSQAAKKRASKLKGKHQNQGICSRTTQGTLEERREKEKRQAAVRRLKARNGERQMPYSYRERQGLDAMQLEPDPNIHQRVVALEEKLRRCVLSLEKIAQSTSRGTLANDEARRALRDLGFDTRKLDDD